MSLRWSLRRVRRRLRPYRLLFAAVAGTVATVLSTVYENMPAGLRIAALVTVGVFTSIAVLITEAYVPLPQFTPTPPSTDGGRTAIGRGERTTRQPGEALPSDRPSFHSPRLPSRSGRVVPALPPSDGLFCGRERELADLLTWHDHQRHARSAGERQGRWRRGRRGSVPRSRKATGPVLLLIHGKPGVGKGALAEELARRLADQYPDGQIVANLGTAGGARPPLDVLKDFLLALGWPEREMPDSAVARAIILRSLTAKRRILFILDAARHAEQLRQVLPSDPAAAVLVTSRPDLTVDPELNTWSYPGERSYQLDVPDDDEAMDIFRAVSGTDDADRPVCAAEIVHMCGNLPAAVRSAAERVSHDGTDICQVAGLLRRSRSRLAGLERPGRPVASLIETEHGRLLPAEQRAFAILALVPAPTFVPWALAPLLNVSHAQAEALMDRLAAAQLIDNLGPDEPTQLARYGFHPLTRLFAHQQAEKLPAAEREQARRHLTEAYLELAAAVVAVRDGGFTTPAGCTWLPAGSPMPARVAALLDRWVRDEYLNLLPVLDLATGRSDLALCWRIGTWLGSCVPVGVDLGTAFIAYAQALDASEKERNRLGNIDVLLAKGTFLAAIERYRDAEECLEAAARAARGLRDGADTAAGRDAARREAAANRKLGEAFLQNSSYRQAIEALYEAAELADVAGDEAERQLVQLLIAETHHVEYTEATYEQTLDGRLPDGNLYRVYIALAEAARRRGDRESAHDHLEQAWHFVSGDLHRMASVQVRMSALHLDARPVDGTEADVTIPSDAVHAIRHAARAAVTFSEMRNEAGALRAHCLLARGLLAAGRPVEAAQVARAADRNLAALGDLAEAVWAPLAAQVTRAKGELLRYTGEAHAAGELLMDAATIFGAHEDWAAQRETIGMIGGNWGLGGRAAAGVPPTLAATVDRIPLQRAGEDELGGPGQPNGH